MNMMKGKQRERVQEKEVERMIVNINFAAAENGICRVCIDQDML